MPKEPNYLYLTLSLLAAIVLMTAAPPLSLPTILGILTGGLTLLVTAYLLTGRKRELVLAILLAVSALLPFAWFNIYPQARVHPLALRIYALDLAFWLLFTCYIGIMVFRGIVTARSIRGNEVYGAIYLYLLMGVLFAQIYQLLLAWQPAALYFDPGRFEPAQLIAGGRQARGVGDVLYYSFVTLGTVGYGDVTPSSPVARSVSLIEAVSGIMYVATMIARFVSIQIGAQQARGE